MATDLGPEMLRRLDDKLEAGEIDRATHEAKRAEVLELIRRGKAVEYTTGERLRRAGGGLFLLFAGICFTLSPMVPRSAGDEAPYGLVLFGMILAAFGAALAWRRWRE